MTIPPILASGRALVWFWAGIAGVGAAGVTTLAVMGPLPAAPVMVADATPATPGAAPTIVSVPTAGSPLWPATTASPDPSTAALAASLGAASGAAGTPAPSGAPAAHAVPPARPAAQREARITVVPPMPPEAHHPRAPGPRVFARLELRSPHHNPTRDRVVTYDYAEAEPQMVYSRGMPQYQGYAASYPPAYGWYQGPRGYPRGQYYGYYPSY